MKQCMSICNKNKLMSGPQVHLKQGNLLGKIERTSKGQGYVSFKGIPYAKPPIGNLRFKNPQPPESWKSIRDATEHGDVCLHQTIFTGDMKGSEDCLYLNVYIPLEFWMNSKGTCWTKHSRKANPVMFWIHGGSFRSDSGNSEDYGPDYFMSLQEVILVTINYRLEILGFLCLEDEEAPGNMALKDQAAALKWVNKNISEFGGDPKNVTLFGESAGGASVTYHLFSPMSRGLFHKVIAQSAVCTCFWAKTTNTINLAFRLGKYLGKDTNDKKELLDYLKSLPVESLVNLFDKMKTSEDEKNDTLFHFGPVIESSNSSEAFITELPEKLLYEGKFNDVPIILGYNSGEGMIFSQKLLANKEQVNKDFSHFIPLDLLPFLNEDGKQDLALKIKKFYFQDESFNEETIENMINLRSDTAFCYRIYQFAKLYSKVSTNPVYFYHFNCVTQLNVFSGLFRVKNENLVSHADDLFYFFNRLSITDLDTDEGKLIKRNVKLWSNMARYSNPTPSLDEDITVKWNPITKDKFSYIKIANSLESDVDPDKERMKFWDEIYDKNYKPGFLL